jgi:hypothetical protein
MSDIPIRTSGIDTKAIIHKPPITTKGFIKFLPHFLSGNIATISARISQNASTIRMPLPDMPIQASLIDSKAMSGKAIIIIEGSRRIKSSPRFHHHNAITNNYKNSPKNSETCK